MDKSSCVRWLIARGEGELSFSLSRALAFGDVPESVDRPLTAFPPMQFISLALKDSTLTPMQSSCHAADQSASSAAAADAAAASPPSMDHVQYVGGEEEGTAVFLSELISSCEMEAEDGPLFTPNRVAACAQRARARVVELQDGGLLHSTLSSFSSAQRHDDLTSPLECSPLIHGLGPEGGERY